jgi:endoglucanase
MQRKKIAAALCSAVMLLTSVSLPTSVSAQSSGEMRDISTMELVQDMGIGINLGNTFEACGDWISEYTDGSAEAYETAWGSPVVTQEIIQGYADEGFGVLRIPVAWSNRMFKDENGNLLKVWNDDGSANTEALSQNPDYEIDSEYMARITQVVDWAMDAGLYVIINIHWDNGWVNTFPDNKEECMRRYTLMWTQISSNFKDYGDHLLFESQNEELGWDSVWNKWAGDSGKAESYALVNEINQRFVDTVRSTGGNNGLRHLLISGYNTGIDVTCDSMFRMPDDPANRCAVSVHYYSPAGFAILTEDADWGKASSTWGTDEEFAEMYANMDMLKTNFIDKGIPVIIGEYGCPSENKDPESVRLFLSSVCKAAYERQICPILWDTPGGRYNRSTCQLDDPLLKAAYDSITGREEGIEATSELTEPTEVFAHPVGDVNGDGSVTLLDLVQLQKYLIGIAELNAGQSEYADVTEDGSVDAFDLAALKRILLQNS